MLDIARKLQKHSIKRNKSLTYGKYFRPEFLGRNSALETQMFWVAFSHRRVNVRAHINPSIFARFTQSLFYSFWYFLMSVERHGCLEKNPTEASINNNWWAKLLFGIIS